MYNGKRVSFFMLKLLMSLARKSSEIHYLLFKVGDPKQLPATVLSSVASKFRYECSMFERLQRAGHPVIMLTKQVKEIAKSSLYLS